MIFTLIVERRVVNICLQHCKRTVHRFISLSGLSGSDSAAPPTLGGKRRRVVGASGAASSVLFVWVFFLKKSDSLERRHTSSVHDLNRGLVTYKAPNSPGVFSKLAECPFNASLEVPRTAPFRHLTAARLSSFCLAVFGRSGLAPRQSNGPRAQVFLFFF